MKRIVIIILFLVGTIGAAQTNQELFETAKEQYSKDNFQDAIANWLKILETGNHSKAVYFNLGNAYYKTNQAAPSIYYYEKALQLDPTDQEVKNNLIFAQNMRVDIIEPLPKTVFAKWYSNAVGLLTAKGWAVSSVVFIFLVVLGFLGYYFSASTRRKRLLFIGTFVFLIGTITSFTMAYLSNSDAKNKREAIVFAEVLEVKDAPTESGTVSFELHPGTKVSIAGKDSTWYRIRLVDGKEGWASAEGLKEL